MPKGAGTQFQMKGLREKRGQLRTELEKLGTKLHAEQRAMSAEEKTVFEKLKTDFAAVSEAIKAGEADLAELDSLVNADMGDPAGEPAPAEEGANSAGRENVSHRAKGGDGESLLKRAADIKLAKQAWARRQYGFDLSPDHLAACKRVGLNPNHKVLELRLGDPATRKQRMQERALTVTTSAGGYLIAQDYSHELETALVDYSNVRGVCREIQTENGAALPWPTEDDTGNTGELLAINTEVAYADPTFASVTFAAYKFSSKGVIVPNELIQDSAFDVDAMVFAEIGVRIGRVQGTYFTTGTGSSQPKGVVACASAGLTTASATAFTADELTKLMVAVDPAYTKNGSCGYMMANDVLAYALMLKDSSGRPLVRESYRQGVGGGDGAGVTINGYPVFVNQKMTGLTSSLPVTATKHVLFGDFKKFIVRDAGTVRLMRLDERWAEKDQVGFIGFLRSDSNCVNTAAIKYLLQA